MGLTIGTPLPHGGKLVDRVVTNPAKGKKMAKHCDAVFDIKPTLSDNGVPLRNVYREIMSTCYGFFSPVEGSMTKAEVDRVVKEKRLLSEWVFPYPLVFDISEQDLDKLGVKEGDSLLLRVKGKPFAILDIDEIWKIDNTEEMAHKIFGTPKDNPEVVKEPFDKKMPGWLIYKNLNPMVIAGKYTIINEPKLLPPFDRFWYPPKKSREEYQKRGWRTVINHQTRNVPHVGHEFLMKNAAYTGDIEPCHGIQVNAIIGVKRPGDFPDEAIIEGHEAVNLGGYINPKRHLVSFCLWDMRYGNPLESMLHGIIRQNMGCTHHMFGRDHAAVGKYYDMYATQILWGKGIPSFGFPAPITDVPYGLQIRPQNMAEFWYCPKCGEIAYSATCAHEKEKQKFSGSFIRGMVAEGVFPPPVIFRPEVYKVILKWWKEFNYPFCNPKYCIDKEQRLEIDLPDMKI
jgi:sulfate adenylyltransferase